MIWFCLVCFSLVVDRTGLVCLSLNWFGFIWFGLNRVVWVWFDLVWFGLIWIGLVWFGLVRLGSVRFGLGSLIDTSIERFSAITSNT